MYGGEYWIEVLLSCIEICKGGLVKLCVKIVFVILLYKDSVKIRIYVIIDD